jgi:valyl-tRNA synthetase
MVMMGLSFTGEAPFRTVYLHGLVRDGQGRKMSKTYGNVIDPIEVMDQFGTDALRFTLLTGSTPGNDMNLSLERIEANRNFANKIWNAARFLVSNLDGEMLTGTPACEGLSLPDRWILSQLQRLIESVNRLFDHYLYGEAGRQVYEFLWSEYADWYIEISKIALYGDDATAKSRTRQVLTYVLDQCLRLLHPFVPFVTEEIWQHIPHEGEALIVAPWPEPDKQFADEAAESAMEVLKELIRGIRNVRAEYKVEPSKRVQVVIAGGEWASLLEEHRELFIRLANVDDQTLRIAPAIEQPPEQAVTVTVNSVVAFLPLARLVNLDAERERLRRELSETVRQAARTEGLLANAAFLSNAPADVVERERDKLADLQARQATLQQRLQEFG